MSTKKEAQKPPDEEEFLPKLESAAQEAAVADGLIPAEPGDSKAAKKPSLRRGKWTSEEESYANRLIYEFKLGLLPLTDGTTLRTFLSKLLNCDPMRISKKFVGQNCIGKQVFRRRQQDLEKLTPEQIETSRRELAELERKFLERVAQSNRSKAGTVKDGKGYEDENGNPVLAPWMVPPDDMTDINARAAAAHHASNRTQQSFPGEGTYPNMMGVPGSYPQSSSSKLVGNFGSRPDLASIDYHLYNQGNPAIMSQIVHANGVPTYAYYPSYAIPTTGRSVDFSNAEGQASLLEGLHRANFPPMGWLTAHPADSSTFDARTNAALVHSAMSGNSHDWPSMGNLLGGGGGESMENIAQYLASYQSQNGESAPQLDGDEKGKESEPASASKGRGDDIGLSLDDSGGSGSASKMLSAVKANLFGHKPGLGKWQDRMPIVDPSKTDGIPFVIPSDMAAMAQMYVNTNPQDDSRSVKIPFLPGIKSEPKTSGASDSNVGISSSAAADQSQVMPRNSSVENFWMLVNMGDLPRPDQSVLSEVVFDYPKAASRGSLNGKSESNIDSKSPDEKEAEPDTSEATDAMTMRENPQPPPLDANSPDEPRVGEKRVAAPDDEYGLSLDDGQTGLDDLTATSPAQKRIKLDTR